MLALTTDEEPQGGQVPQWQGLQVSPVVADRGQVVATDLVVSITLRCVARLCPDIVASTEGHIVSAFKK